MPSGSRPLSSKAMGKQPMPNNNHHLSIRTTASRVGTPSEINDDVEDWASASGASAGASASSRRVQPARARRGVAAGSLVGTNDVDKRLLDMLRRKGVFLSFSGFGLWLTMLWYLAGESEPLIPAYTNFVLTTDASLLPSSSTSSVDLNRLAEELYFERPEVMEAIRTQQQVQIPEFRELTDEDRVTGRLRSRNEVVRLQLEVCSTECSADRYGEGALRTDRRCIREKTPET